MSATNYSVPETVAEKSNFTQHGQLFHVKLLMLILLRAYNSWLKLRDNGKNNGYEFKLDSELAEAEYFDDIIFRYKEDSTSKLKFRLFQVKSKEAVRPELLVKITEKDLLSQNNENDFSIQKYFRSFTKIKNILKMKSDDKFEAELFREGEIQDVILITNTQFESDELEIFFRENELKSDTLLKIELEGVSSPKMYIINYDEENMFLKRLKTVFEITSDFSELVKKLAEHLIIKTPIDMTNKIIKEYSFSLIRHVFTRDHEVAQKSKKKLYYAKFKHNFLNIENSNDSTVEEFRRSLLKEYLFRKNEYADCFANLILKTKIRHTTFQEKLVQSIGYKYEKYSIESREFDDVFSTLINPDTKKFLNSFNTKPEYKNLRKIMVERLKQLNPSEKSTKNLLKTVEFSLLPDFSKLPFDRNDLLTLAKTLAFAIKNKNFDELTSDKFKRYLTPLKDEVFDISSKTFQERFKECIRSSTSQSKANRKKPLSASAILFRDFLIDMLIDDDATKKIAVALKNEKVQVTKGFSDNLVSSEVPEMNDETLRKIEQLMTDLEVFEGNELKKNCEILQNFKPIVKKYIGYIFVERNKHIEISKRFLSQISIPSANKLKELKFSARETGLEACKESVFFRELPKKYAENDTKAFFEKFKLVINYPDRNKIDVIIADILRDNLRTHDVTLVQSYLETTIHSWAANRVRTTLDKEYAVKKFNTIQNLTSLYELQGITKSFFSTVNHDVECNENIIEEFLLSKNKKILHLANEDLKLSRSSVGKSFRKLKLQEINLTELCEYTFIHRHMFFYLHQLSDNKFKEQLWNILYQKDTKDTIKLIVIECKQPIENYHMELHHLIKQSKKIILVSSGVNDFLFLLEKEPELNEVWVRITEIASSSSSSSSSSEIAPSKDSFDFTAFQEDFLKDLADYNGSLE